MAFSFHCGLCQYVIHYSFFETRYHKNPFVNVNVCIRVLLVRFYKNSMLLNRFIRFSINTYGMNTINKTVFTTSSNIRKCS